MIMARQPATRAEFVLFDVFYAPTASEVELFPHRQAEDAAAHRVRTICPRCGRYPLRNRGTAT
jgi:hypothetical protein